MAPKTKDLDRDPRFRWFWDTLDQYLLRHHLKQTSQRKLIVSHILRLNTHLDAEELHRHVERAGHKNIGLATIYRTLTLLKTAGLLEQKSFQDGRSLFEIIVPDSHHDHLICRQCGRVIEFENDQIEKIQHEIARRYGFRLESHRLDLFGDCLNQNCDYKPQT